MFPYKPRARPFIIAAVVLSVVTNFVLVERLGFDTVRVLVGPGIIIFLVSSCWLLFDRYAWRWKPARLFGLSHQPDIGGVWKGDVNRIGEENPHSFVMEITQTFTKVSIKTSSQNSDGYSIHTYFLCDEHHENFVLVNFWNCRTKSRTKKYAMEEFKGLSQVSIAKDHGRLILRDYYFTDRNPPTAGRLELERMSR